MPVVHLPRTGPEVPLAGSQSKGEGERAVPFDQLANDERDCHEPLKRR
jgi:hypothetical protein